jgi:putative flippase GtrA
MRGDYRIIAAMGRELARFAIVGAIGFSVDAGVLHLLVAKAGWSPFAARALSFPPALTSTFLLNRAWTFKSLRIPAVQAYGAYTLIQIAGALINLAVFALCVLLVPVLYQWPLIALAIGAGASLLFNFFASRRLVFVK